MDPSIELIDSALSEVVRARTSVLNKRTVQIRQPELIDNLKSLAYAWFQSHRPQLKDRIPPTALAEVDVPFQRILDATSKASARTTYLAALGDAKEALTSLRATALLVPTSSGPIFEHAPDFSPLASDAIMQDILVRRWGECQRCLGADAHLAATVMMGGFLEALFVAKVNQLKDKSTLFRAKAIPIDPSTGKKLQLQKWTLGNYIDVAEELRWITRSAKGIAVVLRDYRNYVHPEKERSHGIKLNGHDSSMFWQVTKSLANQLLDSVPRSP